MTEIVLGPPGTGKTTTLLNMVDEELARGVPPDRIGYYSFTKRAAEEAITRACEKFNLSRDDFPHFRTLHSHCFRALGMRRQDVLEGPRMQEFAREAGVRITGKMSEDGTLSGFEDGDRILFMENLSRVRCISLREQYDGDDDALNWSYVERVSRMLREFKTREQLSDYTDMLQGYLDGGRRPDLDTVIVDEAQDLSQLQWRVVQDLFSGARRTAVAGDDDQAIYPWAGADVDHFVALAGDERVLGQSWRVPRTVQEIAARIISGVHNRREKKWLARDGAEGRVDFQRYFGDVEIDGDRETLVLVRNTYILREQVMPELRRRGIVFMDHRGNPSVDVAAQNAVLWWERLRRGDRLRVEQVRAVYEMLSSGRGVKRGFKTLPNFPEDEELSLQDLKERGGLNLDGPWFEVMDRLGAGDREYIRSALTKGQRLGATPRVRVSTIHSSKGGQADHVVVLREMASRTWREYELSPENEARVWYVAVTRAKEHLSLVDSDTAREYPI